MVWPWTDLGKGTEILWASAFSLVDWEELHLFHSRITNFRDQCRTLTPMPGPLCPQITSSGLVTLPLSELPPRLALYSPVTYDLSPPSEAPPRPKLRLPADSLQALWWINKLETSIFRFDVLHRYKSKHTHKNQSTEGSWGWETKKNTCWNAPWSLRSS